MLLLFQTLQIERNKITENDYNQCKSAAIFRLLLKFTHGMEFKIVIDDLHHRIEKSTDALMKTICIANRKTTTKKVKSNGEKKSRVSK